MVAMTRKLLAAIVAALVLFVPAAGANVFGVTNWCSPSQRAPYAYVHIHNNATGANGSTNSGSSASFNFGGTTPNTSYTLYAQIGSHYSDLVTRNTGSGNSVGAVLCIH